MHKNLDNSTRRVFFEQTKRYVELPQSCEGCGECCRNFATVTDATALHFFESTTPETTHVIVTPIEVRTKPSKSEQEHRRAAALSANLGIADEPQLLHSIEKGKGLIVIKGPCGNLDSDNRCVQYEDRPESPCREVTMGSYACLSALDTAQNPRLNA